MLDLIHYILSSLVTYPQDLRIQEAVDAYQQPVFEISVHFVDRGAVIGKQGMTLDAVDAVLLSYAQSHQQIKPQIKILG